MAINLEIFKKLLKRFRISNMSVYTLVSDSFVRLQKVAFFGHTTYRINKFAQQWL